MFLGWKPLSIFGVMDSIGKGGLRDHFNKEYPNLKEERSPAKDQRGHLALLREHLIDLDILDHEKSADSTRDAGTDSQHPEMTEQSELPSAWMEWVKIVTSRIGGGSAPSRDLNLSVDSPARLCRVCSVLVVPTLYKNSIRMLTTSNV